MNCQQFISYLCNAYMFLKCISRIQLYMSDVNICGKRKSQTLNLFKMLSQYRPMTYSSATSRVVLIQWFCLKQVPEYFCSPPNEIKELTNYRGFQIRLT